MTYFKYLEHTVPEDHTGRWFKTIKILNPAFIGPLNKWEHESELLYDILAEQIRNEIDEQILENLNFLVDKH